jgi:hypothetical protein
MGVGNEVYHPSVSQTVQRSQPWLVSSPFCQ